jgi:hypothetical protein
MNSIADLSDIGLYIEPTIIISKPIKFKEPNMFEDACSRFLSGNPVSNVFKDPVESEKYIKNFKSQMDWRVPKEITKNILIPFMQHRMMLAHMDKNPFSTHGIYLTATDDGNVNHVTGVYGNTYPNEVAITYKFMYNADLTDIIDENGNYHGGSFYIDEDTPATEVMRRFWITVFNRVFDCGWWNIYDFIV